MKCYNVIIVALCLLCTACVNRSGKVAVADSASYQLDIPSPPVMMDPAAQRDYFRKHFWDNLDFSDSTVPSRIDTNAFRTSFVSFASLLREEQDGGVALVRSLMEKAGQNAPMMDMFFKIARAVFYDPNSPLRNDELYLPVLEAISGSPLVSEESRAYAAETMMLVSRNCPGNPAEDFSFLTIQNRPGSLYGIRAPYTLVFFSNPGCNMCRDIREAMSASSLIGEMVRSRKLVVLALYPDEDSELWLYYKDEIPSEWINARDPGCTISASGLYDLKAIPSLYLLDADKTVILKDCTDVRQIEAALSR